jgi:MiaB/RimO family radical SAM methylthiotransferase
MECPRRFYLVNENVCIRLLLYGQDISALLIKNNWKESQDIKEADIIFINTCSFIRSAEDKAITKIEKIIKNKKSHQEVVVFGCLPDINPERLGKIHQGISLSGRNLKKLIETFNLRYFERKVGHRVIRPGPLSARIIKYLNKFFFRDDYFTYLFDKEKVFHLKISEGCLGQCTYCSERIARGSLKSKPISEIMEEFQEGLNGGYRIFSLNADDVGVFGRDNQENIAQLLEEMLKIEKDFRLVITELNPLAFLRHGEKIVKLLTSPKIIFITVPLESGSQRILRLMKRPYLIKEVMPLLSKIKVENPKIKINTHIIVGFPGETNEDFQETFNLLDKFYFNKVKVFKYSERPGTPANLMPNKVCEEERERRQKILNQKVILGALKRLDIKAILLNKIGF